MNNRVRCHSGFTLLEVLVAFSLLSLSLSVIMLGISKSLRTSEVTREFSRAIVLAESRLAVFSQADLSNMTETQGRFDSHYDWHVNIEPYESQGEFKQGGNLIAYKLTVKVSWPGRSNQREVTLSTIRLGPVNL